VGRLDDGRQLVHVTPMALEPRKCGMLKQVIAIVRDQHPIAE
jgi:hypothetical protein